MTGCAHIEIEAKRRPEKHEVKANNTLKIHASNITLLFNPLSHALSHSQTFPFPFWKIKKEDLSLCSQESSQRPKTASLDQRCLAEGMEWRDQSIARCRGQVARKGHPVHGRARRCTHPSGCCPLEGTLASKQKCKNVVGPIAESSLDLLAVLC